MGTRQMVISAKGGNIATSRWQRRTVDIDIAHRPHTTGVTRRRKQIKGVERSDEQRAGDR